jgi:YggT family protein
MFIVKNFILAVASLLDTILQLYLWIIIARAVVSWVSPDPYNPIVQFLYRVTEPVMEPIRRKMGYGMGIDLSPMVVMLGIVFLQRFLVPSLRQMAFGL